MADDTGRHEANSPAAAIPAALQTHWPIPVIAVVLLSTILAYGTAFYAPDYLSPGAGFPPPDQDDPTPVFFRFDSEHYREIALHGYSFDGRFEGSPNLVFAPLYPLEVRLLYVLSPLRIESAGLWVARLDFLVAALLLFHVIRNWFGLRAAIFVLAGICFSPGSYAFHAFYSESTMLVWLAAALFCLQRRWHWPLAAAAFFLSASRSTAGPFCLAFALWFVYAAWQEFRQPERNWTVITTRLVQAPLCLGGLLIFLSYLWYNFGNPFVLLPQIQAVSWGKFHQPVAWWEVLCLKHMFVHGWAICQRDGAILTDVRTINYIWTLLAITAAIYCAVRCKHQAFKWGFAGYVLLIYKMNVGTPWLISTPRFFALMLPLFLLASDLHGLIERCLNRYVAVAVSIILLLISAAYYVIYTAHFTMGHWYYF